MLLVNKTNDHQQVDVFLELAKLLSDTATEKSFSYAYEALKMATSSGYTKGKADARIIIGNYLLGKGKHVSALQFFLGALSIYKSINNQEGMLGSIGQIGILFLQMKSYANAEDFYTQGLDLSQSLNKVYWTGLFLQNIGKIRQIEGRYEEAYVLYNKAILAFRQSGLRNSEMDIYNSMGGILLDQKKFDEALDLFTKIIRNNDTVSLPFFGTVYTRLAHIYSQLNKPEESLQWNKKALTARIQAYQKEEANSSLINIAGSYFVLNQADSAWKYMDEGLKQAKKFNRKNLLEHGYKILYVYMYKNKHYKQALEYFQQYSAMGDSIRQEKLRSEIAMIEANQRALNLEWNNELLLKQNEIQRLSLQTQKAQLVFLQSLTGFSLILIIIFLFQFMRNWRRKIKLQVVNDQLSLEMREHETTQSQIRAREKKYRFIAEHTVDLITRIDFKKQCVYASPSAEKIFGYSPEEILKKIPYGCTHPAYIQLAENHFSEMIRERKPKQFSFISLRKNGETFWVEILLNPVFDEITGEFREAVSVLRDIQELKNKEVEIIEGTKQKENLLKEIHHRVKNNFAILVSLINMQKDRTNCPIQPLTNLQLRIRTMALVHEMLYRSKDFENISFSDYLQSLSSVITGTYDARQIQLHFDVEEITMDIDNSIPLGLIVNEVIANSCKHAFSENRPGNIWIGLKLLEEGKVLQLRIRDDGMGLPDELFHENTKTMGLQIVQLLVKQIEGNLKMKNCPGLEIIITFPRNKS